MGKTIHVVTSNYLLNMRFNEDPVSILTSHCEIKMGVFANNDDNNNINLYCTRSDICIS